MAALKKSIRLINGIQFKRQASVHFDIVAEFAGIELEHHNLTAARDVGTHIPRSQLNFSSKG